MASRTRARFVALRRLLGERFPELADPTAAIVAGRVIVDGRVVDNPAARVRRDAGIRLRADRRLRGREKLVRALDALDLQVEGVVALDAGAAAGGFTQALLDRGAARVHAVDVGHGQLAGSLRQDRRVVNRERTNLAALDDRVVPDALDLVTMDLSYLAVADAVGYLDRLRYAPEARLLALVKPTFELRAAALVTDPAAVRTAARSAVTAIEAAGWRVSACTLPAETGAGGAIEVFVLAYRDA